MPKVVIKRKKGKPYHFYCFRHKGYFFSKKYLIKKKIPKQCPICKRKDWNIKKIKERKKRKR